LVRSREHAADSAPAKEPAEEFDALDEEGVGHGFAVAVIFREPTDQLPVLGREEFLFLGGSEGEFDDFLEGAVLFSGAAADHVEREHQAALAVGGIATAGFAKDPEAGAWGVEMIGGRGEEPTFEVGDKLLITFGLLLEGETFKVGVPDEFGGQGAIGAEEEVSGFFEAALALGAHEFGPPVIAGEIASRQRQFLKIVLEQEPGALGIPAGGELAEDDAAFGDGALGVGELAAQVREGAIGAPEHVVVSVVARGGG